MDTTDIKTMSVSDLHTMLNELDEKSIRPLRAIVSGNKTDTDINLLIQYERDIQRIRDELNRRGV